MLTPRFNDTVRIANVLLTGVIVSRAPDNEPPDYWRVTDRLPVPQFSHQDATALCRRADGTVAEPIEIQALR